MLAIWLAAAAALAPPSAHAATRPVVVVGNAFAGTVSFLDGTTFDNLGSIDIAPDRRARRAQLLRDPLTFIGFSVVKNQKSGENLVDDMALTPDGKTLIVSRGILEDVVAYDIATRAVKWRVAVGGYNADHMAISPDGRRVAVSASSAGVTQVFDTATGSKLASMKAGDFPHGVDFSEDGRRIYIGSIGTTYLPFALNSLKGSRQLTVVDATTYQVLRVYKQDLGVRPTVILRDQTKAYFQRSYRRGFVELDLASGRYTRIANVPGTTQGDARFPDRLPANSMHHGLAINADETRFCNAGTIDEQVSIVDRATLKVLTVADGFSKPYWAQNDLSGTQCLISNSTANAVSVVSYATGQELKRIPVGRYPQRERLGVLDEGAAATLDPKVG